MTSEIARILKNKLAAIDNGENKPTGLLFIYRMAGLVVVGEKVQPTDIEGAFAVTKFPISLDTDYEECINKGCYKDLVPNSKNKGILYFESQSTIPLGKEHGSYKYATRLRLVCWINNKLIQGTNCSSIAHIMMTKIRAALETGPFNSGSFTRISAKAVNIVENDYKLFSNYSYPQESVKYLMHPYEAFGIDYLVEYSISNNCIEELTITPETC